MKKLLGLVTGGALLLVLLGCGTVQRPAAVDVTLEDQLKEALAELYPGYEWGRYIEKDKGVHFVEAHPAVAPGFVARLQFIVDSSWERETDVGGVVISTNTLLDETTDDAQLLTGGLRESFLKSAAKDAGELGESTGRYVTQLDVVSNVEMRLFVLEPSGLSSSYSYKLDMRASPNVFRLEQAYDNSK